jgi:alpha-ketoglutarate-dependent taurine dioxygenase
MRPLSGGWGAELLGFEITGSPSPEVVRALREALLEHSLLLLRGQALPPARHIRFARVFGAHVHRCTPTFAVLPAFPEIFRVSNRGTQGHPDRCYWHSDGAYLEDRTAITVQHIVTPSDRGDTLYANTTRVYDHLSPSQRARLDCLRTRAQTTGVVHSLVQRHPHTGRTGLYVNLHPRAVIVDAEGREQPDVEDLLRDRLTAGSYRHRWRRGDVVMVDELAVAGCGTPADPRSLRVLHRVTVPGHAVPRHCAAR